MSARDAVDQGGSAFGRLVVAEGLGLVREGLVALLSSARSGGGRSGIVHAARTVGEALVQLSRNVAECGSAGVLLLDLSLLGEAGPGALGSIREQFPTVRIVALAGVEVRDEVLRCLAGGAHGYVAKSASAAELVQAVCLVEQGGVHVPATLAVAPGAALGIPPGREPGMARAMTAPVPRESMGQGAGPTRTLTGRQRDVLRLMAEGRSTKDIARTLDLAVSTIKVHLAGVYRAVGARNRVEALCRAGLVPRDAVMS